MAPAEKATKSGIITDSTGASHIPSSTRADGSVRKEIRVRPGYRPPEDVEVYKNRTAEAWKTRGQGKYVPGAEIVDPKQSKPAAQAQAKKKQKGKADGESKGEQGKPNGGTDGIGSNGTSESTTTKEPVNEPIDSEAEKEKEARKLSKKLRQAKDLQQKKDNGDSLLPEQLEKVVRMNELIRQLDHLGFDQDGKKKDG